MKGKLKCILIILAVAFMVGCSNTSNLSNVQEKSDKVETVSANVIFRALTIEGEPIEQVGIIIIDSYGNVIDKLVTDEKGEAIKKLTVPIDPKYAAGTSQDIELRGTVTAIAFKDGYRETVLFETPVSNGSAAQSFYMEQSVLGERNEPVVQIGNNHHLEILSLVEKYAEYNNGN